MPIELYRKHRPAALSELFGQNDAVGVVGKWIKKKTVPHAILLSGPSGCGKTTIARILQRMLGCHKHDFDEKNCADFRGIDTVRDIRRKAGLSPIGACRIFLLDEVHQMGGPPQNALLKLLEDTPDSVYYFLCTTDPQKLIPTIRTRCSEIRLRSLTSAELAKLVVSVAGKEQKKLSTEVVERIADVADGSARKALVILHAVLDLDDEESQLEAIAKSDTKTDAIEICRALLNRNTRWPDMSKILRTVDLSDSEGIRYMVLSYCEKILLNKANPRAASIMDRFLDPTYDSKKWGIMLACYDLVTAK